jgi:ATP-dependent DNA helicase RecG
LAAPGTGKKATMSSARTADQLAALVRELIALPRETEWVEDKQNNTNSEMIGQYISALANSAALEATPLS